MPLISKRQQKLRHYPRLFLVPAHFYWCLKFYNQSSLTRKYITQPQKEIKITESMNIFKKYDYIKILILILPIQFLIKNYGFDLKLSIIKFRDFI